MLRCMTPSHHISTASCVLFRAFFLADLCLVSLLDLSLTPEDCSDDGMEPVDRHLRPRDGVMGSKGARELMLDTQQGQRVPISRARSSSSSNSGFGRNGGNGKNGGLGSSSRVGGALKLMGARGIKSFCISASENCKLAEGAGKVRRSRAAYSRHYT